MRFILDGEFGHPKVEIVVTHGDYVAETVNRGEDENVVKKTLIRPTEAEEGKEIEPVPTEDEPTHERA